MSEYDERALIQKLVKAFPGKTLLDIINMQREEVIRTSGVGLKVYEYIKSLGSRKRFNIEQLKHMTYAQRLRLGQTRLLNIAKQGAILLLLLCSSMSAFALDTGIIASIESNKNDKAVSYRGAKYGRGRHQISEAMLQDYNYYNKTTYKKADLFNREVNTKICIWAISKRIPQLLKHYNVSITDKNILMAYNWGAKNVQRHYQNNKSIPSETKNYVKKYNQRV